MISRKVDVRLPGKWNSNSHGARPVHLIIMMIQWIRTSRLSIKNSLSSGDICFHAARGAASPLLPPDLDPRQSCPDAKSRQEFESCQACPEAASNGYFLMFEFVREVSSRIPDTALFILFSLTVGSTLRRHRATEAWFRSPIPDLAARCGRPGDYCW